MNFLNRYNFHFRHIGYTSCVHTPKSYLTLRRNLHRYIEIECHEFLRVTPLFGLVNIQNDIK